jgi:phosphopantetheine adenylyltransferase
MAKEKKLTAKQRKKLTALEEEFGNTAMISKEARDKINEERLKRGLKKLTVPTGPYRWPKA